MLWRSLEATDITAALARCAISPSDRPEARAGLLSTDAGAGTFIANLAGGASFGFGASASFEALALRGASASLGGCGTDATSAAFDSTPCGCAAVKRSLNMDGEIAAMVAGFAASGAGSAANASLIASEALRVAITLDGSRTTGAS